jgi:hypothetical protein
MAGTSPAMTTESKTGKRRPIIASIIVFAAMLSLSGGMP